MASCNLSYSGDKGVINASAYITEVTTSGTSRRVRVNLTVYAVDYSGGRDGSYWVECSQSGTDISENTVIDGSEQSIFNEEFTVSVSRGSSTASINLSFGASLTSPSAGKKSISGSISTLYLTEEPAATASTVSVSPTPVQMGKKVTISINRDSSGSTHTLEYKFGSKSGTIATDVGGSYAWTVPDLAASCNNATSGTCTITCKTYNNGSYIGSTTCSLTLNVPDATAVSASDGTLGTEMTVSISPKSSNFTHEIKCEFYSDTVTISGSTKGNVKWTPPYDLAKQIKNLTYGTATVKCTTKNGTAVVGETSKTIRLTVPENDTTRPKITDVVLSVITDLTGDLAELYIRGKTGLRAEITAESTYSDISSYSVTAGSVQASGNPAVIDVLVNDGDVAVTVKVTDARGFSASWNGSISVLPYSRPKITPYTGYSEVICERALSTGELNSDGTYLAIKAGRKFSSFVYGGTERNACTLRYRYKNSSAEQYGDWVTLIGPDSKDSEIQILVSDIVTSTSTSYNIEISAVDSLGGEHSMVFQIMTASVSFVLYDGVDGAGFGKYPEEPHVVDIASHMTLLVRGKLKVMGESWVSLGFAGGVEDSPYSYGRGDGTGCYYKVSYGNHVHISFNCSFNYTGSEFTINSTPIPESYRPNQTVCSLCPVNDRHIALVSVQTDGYIRVEWVQALKDTVDTGSVSILWIDGYLDYWV